jgi:zinc transporter
MSDNNGLIFAFVLDGHGGGSRLELDGVKQWRSADGPLWVHLDYTGNDARDWLQNHSGIEPVMVEALTAEETRPRSLVHKDGMLVILRGVNLNPGMDPEDMVSIRFWIDADRIVTLRHRRVMAIDDLRQAVEAGSGPVSTGEFLEDLADRLVLRMGGVISDVDDLVDALEDEVISAQTYDLRKKIADLRRTAISMRRYLAPQRDVMARLHNEKVSWLSYASEGNRRPHHAICRGFGRNQRSGYRDAGGIKQPLGRTNEQDDVCLIDRRGNFPAAGHSHRTAGY